MLIEDSRFIHCLSSNLIICPSPLMWPKPTTKQNTTSLLNLSSDTKERIILPKELSVLIAVLLMNIFPTITAIKELKLDARSAKRLSLLKKAILSRLLENALTVALNCLLSSQEIILISISA